jgi:hypothetical protein
LINSAATDDADFGDMADRTGFSPAVFETKL